MRASQAGRGMDSLGTVVCSELVSRGFAAQRRRSLAVKKWNRGICRVEGSRRGATGQHQGEVCRCEQGMPRGEAQSGRRWAARAGWINPQREQCEAAEQSRRWEKSEAIPFPGRMANTQSTSAVSGGQWVMHDDARRTMHVTLGSEGQRVRPAGQRRTVQQCF